MTLFNRNGRLYANLILAGKRKKLSLHMKDTPANRKKALANEAKILKMAKTGNKNAAQCAQAYLERQAGLKASSQAQIAKHLEAVLKMAHIKGTDKPEHISKAHIANFYKTLLAKKPSKAYANTLTARLKSFLDFLEETEHLEKSPFFKQKMTALRPAKEVQPFSLEQIKTLLKACTNPRLKAFLAVSFFTGARSGEVLALKWADVNFYTNKITIAHTLTPSGQLQPPKTPSSKRQIDMLPIVAKVLQEYYHQASLQQQGLIFIAPNKTGANLLNHLRAQYKALLKACNIPYRKIYATRHSFASLMLEQGEPLGWVSHTLGHKNLNITLETYAKYIPEENAQHGTFIKLEEFN
ncbi:Integrase [Helicobacter heilmannii]|uniref:site-specific integrase n=1 Tax=Helicobacter heilmannii TaxID=35817 RepID=UPI0006A18CA8|nr:site-specific integrase [Helicobacter heilmannii]CRF50138.1 Integrase [Helicobacter heilmannii]